MRGESTDDDGSGSDEKDDGGSKDNTPELGEDNGADGEESEGESSEEESQEASEGGESDDGRKAKTVLHQINPRPTVDDQINSPMAMRLRNRKDIRHPERYTDYFSKQGKKKK